MKKTYLAAGRGVHALSLIHIYFACRGECPKHRFDRGADGSPKNSLCEGLKIYFRHVEPYMEYMRDLLSKQQAPAWVMPFARKRMGLE